MKKAIAPVPLTPDGPPAARLAFVQATAAAAARAGGHPAPHLIAVSKTHDADAILPFLEAGQRLFGENRVQEATAKWPALKARFPDIELHMIGQLQSNKAADAVALFDAIHSIDRPSLVHAVAKALAHAPKPMTLFLQLNLGDEPQKGGAAPEDLPALLAEAHKSGLVIAGLMTVPPVDEDAAPYFALLAKLARRHNLPSLSMGMSHDYDMAARLGSTHIRVGTALFGARQSGVNRH